MRARATKVLFIVPDLRVGGAERHVATLLPRMDASHFEPSVICIGRQGELAQTLLEAEIPLHALHLGRRQAFRILFELIGELRRTRPDVVVVRGYNAETLGRIAARLAGVRCTIVWVHNIGEPTPRTSVRRLTDRLLDSWTTRYFGVAEAQRTYLTDELRYPADKIRIIHNGVDTAALNTESEHAVLSDFGVPANAPVVGIVAALRAEKDHITFLRAAREVVDEKPEAQFLIVGDGPMRTTLERHARELGLAANVHFTGVRHDVPGLLRAMDVFVLSSVTVECFPISLLEAMACGRPAVCTDVGGIPEMLHDGVTGYLVPPKDSHRMASRLLELLSQSPSRRQEMGLAARAVVETQFSLHRSVAAAESAIEEAAAPGAPDRRRRILILVENLSVPFDRRVWQESRALVEAGYQVTVICPTGVKQDRELEALIDGVRILRYPLKAATGSPLGYVREYSLALWHTLRLALRVRREGPIDIVQACNPPDLLFLIALVLRPGGSRFVFDHHDLVPELFMSRFAGRGQLLYRLTRFTERLTFAAADAVISTNESYRRVAIERGKMAADRVAVVRSAPDLSRFVARTPDQGLRHGKRYLLSYLGVMGPQDGVDYALRALAHLRTDFGRDDFHCIFMGGGDAFDEMVALSEQLGLSDRVEFTGRVSDEFVQLCLSTSDVCLSPDPLNPLNNVSTMNKVVEYMAMGRPIVSFDLVEARVSAGDAAVFVPANDESAFAKAIDALLEDADLRRRMGELGRLRVEQHLSWDTSRRNLIDFYGRLFDEQTGITTFQRSPTP